MCGLYTLISEGGKKQDIMFIAFCYLVDAEF